MSNPYQAPETSGIPASKLGLAGHVPVIATLMIIQGVLELLMGLFLAGMGVVVMMVPTMAPPNAGGQQPPPGIFSMIALVYFAMGVAGLMGGGLKIWAGWKGFSFRGRGLGIAGVSSGFASLLTCFCGPTGVALAIYGLIVYLNDRTAEAFALGEQGLTPEQIREALS